jgi:hypothetical protein
VTVPRAGVPRAAWLAVGIAGAAATAWASWPPVVALVAGLLAIAGGASPLPSGLAAWRTALGAAGVGALLLALRIVALPQAPAGPGIDAAGPGPWTAEVVSVGTPKDGSQLVRLALGGLGEPVVVAATLPTFPTVSAGATVEVAGRLQPPSDDAYGEYLRRTGAAGSLRASSVKVVRGVPRPWGLRRSATGRATRSSVRCRSRRRGSRPGSSSACASGWTGRWRRTSRRPG